MTTLYKHQKDILKDSPSKTLLALGTGGGKTRIALLLAKGKTFVIMPKTQFLDKNWEREVVKLGLSINLTTISKEKFKSVAHTLPTFDTVIVDELHMMCGVTPALRWRKRVAIPGYLLATHHSYAVLRPYSHADTLAYVCVGYRKALRKDT